MLQHPGQRGVHTGEVLIVDVGMLIGNTRLATSGIALAGYGACLTPKVAQILQEAGTWFEGDRRRLYRGVQRAQAPSTFDPGANERRSAWARRLSPGSNSRSSTDLAKIVYGAVSGSSNVPLGRPGAV